MKPAVPVAFEHEKFYCMVCGEERNDAPSGGEMDEAGDWWTYCRPCDAWTCHPVQHAGRNESETAKEE